MQQIYNVTLSLIFKGSSHQRAYRAWSCYRSNVKSSIQWMHVKTEYNATVKIEQVQLLCSFTDVDRSKLRFSVCLMLSLHPMYPFCMPLCLLFINTHQFLCQKNENVNDIKLEIHKIQRTCINNNWLKYASSANCSDFQSKNIL